MSTTVLFIDDDPNITEMLCMHFKMKGFSVYAASDGLEGIEVCRRVKPHVILVDLKMRNMNGDEALPFLRAAAPQAKIILLSGYAREAAELLEQNIEVDAYVEKPASIIELCTMVRHMLMPADPVFSEKREVEAQKTAVMFDGSTEEYAPCG